MCICAIKEKKEYKSQPIQRYILYPNSEEAEINEAEFGLTVVTTMRYNIDI